MRRCAALLLALLLLVPLCSALGEEPPVTRAGFVTLLWRSAGGVPWAVSAVFSDVDPATEGAEAICWAADCALVLGVSGGRFAPERLITREEAAVLLRRSAAALGRDTSAPLGLSLCNDSEGISFWADDSLYWATACGLIAWSPGGLLDPGGTFSPAQAAETVARFTRRHLKRAGRPNRLPALFRPSGAALPVRFSGMRGRVHP